MTPPSSSTPTGAVWQTRLSRELAAAYEEDLQVLGMDRSEALRRGLGLLHQEALEIRMARGVESFYGSDRAPLSGVTQALYEDSVGQGDAADQA